MCDGSESDSTQIQTAESKQILTILGQISKSVEEIKESAAGIKRLEQNTAILSQKIEIMTQRQEHTSAAINVLRNQIAQLVDIQQKALRLQEQQLLEAKLIRIASEKTALETQCLREIAQREERERMQQQVFKAFWYSVHEGVRQVRDNNDSLVKQALLLALRKHISNSKMTKDELHDIPDMLFASEAKKGVDDLARQLLSHLAAQSELNQFVALRASWNDSSSATARLTNTIEQLNEHISRLTEFISDTSVSMQKKRGVIRRFFYDNLWKSRHERQLKETRGQLSEYQIKKTAAQAELAEAKAVLSSVTGSLKHVEISHPSITPFQPWTVPYTEL